MGLSLWAHLQKTLLPEPEKIAHAATLAAVLVPILEKPIEEMLFIQRSIHLKHHAGQVAFPGGRVEQGENVVQTALRESKEEVGLNPQCAEILGFLPMFVTGTGFAIVPVVSKIAPPFDFCANEEEVSAIFTVPLHFLMDARHHKQQRILVDQTLRTFWAMPYQKHFIWGATAQILRYLWHYSFQNSTLNLKKF